MEDRRKLAKLCSKERGQEYVTRPGTHRKFLVGLRFFFGGLLRGGRGMERIEILKEVGKEWVRK